MVRRDVGEIQHTYSVPDTAAELRQRLSVRTEQQYDFVLENDLAGRAALAVLWPHRSHLSIYLVTEDPTDDNIVVLSSALRTVRTPPVVQIVSPGAAAALTTSSRPLVWAIVHDRINSQARAGLQERAKDITLLPYAAPFEALAGGRPDQTIPAHELVLRDIIKEHAGFLNFFGDRFNPQDLYERSKYPSWFTPPLGFKTAIPPLVYSTTVADGTVVATGKFTGSIKLAPQHVRMDHRAQLELQPLLETLPDSSFDVTLHLHNDYANPNGTGALALEVHHNNEVYTHFDIATSAPHLVVSVPEVQRGESLRVSVVSCRDNPRESWAVASETSITLEVHPAGTHPPTGTTRRLKAWLRRVLSRR